MERSQPLSGWSRRQFVSAALVGLAPKSGRRITGAFANESWQMGHRLRDTAAWPRPAQRARARALIIGGGIAGLSAAWRLARRGYTDFTVLELETSLGGNARSGINDVSPYPWGAHYVPLPGAAADLVRELFQDLGVYGEGQWNERHIVHAPRERLFIHGRWQEGLEPAVGPVARDRDQIVRFADRVKRLADTGRFTVPLAHGLTDPRPAEDAISMAAWLDRERLDSPWLRWMVDYACRDDYGALSSRVSAWAGLHYFAARDSADDAVLTWPEGNGWVVRRLAERLGERVRSGQLVHSIEPNGRHWRVLTPEVEWDAEAVILAVPLLVAARIVSGWTRPVPTYSPWLTANLTLDRWPRERGVPASWDNVIFDSPALGYVVATHQTLARYQPRTVWTYYWSFADWDPSTARRWLLAQDWASLKDRILADLSKAHPDIEACVTHVDIMRWGHAMARPTVGFLSARSQLAAERSTAGLFYAHSDASGLPLFEEAQYQGVQAADALLRHIGRN